MKKREFYYNSKTMYLDNWGYPRYKDSDKSVHRNVAEKYIVKRKLKSEEVVHHVNGDKLDYRISNLAVLSKEDHQKIEYQLRKHKNLNIAYEMILALSIGFLIALDCSILEQVKITVLILLIVGMIIPYTPRLLRKFLYFMGAFKKR